MRPPPRWRRSWPATPLSKQKPVQFDKFDPYNEFFKRGAHMPLMIYVGAHSDVRRTRGAQRRRDQNADARGWTFERRQSTKPSGKGKGYGQQKGAGSGKGKEDGEQKGAGACSRGGGDRKGGKWGARAKGQQAPWTGWG